MKTEDVRFLGGSPFFESQFSKFASASWGIPLRESVFEVTPLFGATPSPLAHLLPLLSGRGAPEDSPAGPPEWD